MPATGVRIGPAEFRAADGALTRLADIPVDGPRLDVWRAPTDNDDTTSGDALATLWRRLGLHRMQHRIDSVSRTDGQVLVRTRVAPAAADLALLATYTWSGVDGAGVRLELHVVPDGPWPHPVPLPRLGVRMAVPAALYQVEWFGRGPGEAYVDTGLATRMGRFTSTVEAMQTPYVRPQENGNRRDVRWATISDGSGHGLRIDGAPTFDLTARPWTSEHLTQARHPVELVAGEHIWVNIDAGHHGIGSAACGPGVLEQYRFHAGLAAAHGHDARRVMSTARSIRRRQLGVVSLPPRTHSLEEPRG